MRFVRINLPAVHLIVMILLISGQTRARADDPVKTPTETSKTSDAAVRPTEKTVQELAASAKKSVVVVTFTGRDGQRQGLGAGFILSADGLIATNLHVIGEARPIQIELHDGRKFDVTAVHATERSQDLAILKIDARDLPTLPLGNSDELREGQAVIAIGNPLGLERSVVSGVLSGRRDIDGRNMLQIALPIERGNSGGPLLDLQGHVHGLLTLKSLKSENLGFAIAVNALKPLLDKPNPIPMSRWLTIGTIDADEWTVLPGGRWRQRAGQIAVDGRGGGFGGRAVCISKTAQPVVPYEMSVQVKFTPGDGAAGLVFHSDGGDKHYGFYPSNGNVRFSRFDGPDVYSWAVLRETRANNLKKDGWNLLKVRVESDRVFCFLNGEQVFEVDDSTYKTGSVGLCKFRQTEAEFKSFRVGERLTENKPDAAALERITKAVEGMTHEDSSFTTALQQLKGEGAVVDAFLEHQAKALESRAAQLRRLATDIHTRRTLSEFQSEIQRDQIDLLRAALLISKLDNPELELEAYIGQLERHTARIRAAVAENSTEEERFAALNRYLFEEQGFHGSRTDYGNRSNSYINEVLEDREGLPITLSVLYIEIAKQLNLNIVGVGMPSHFLTRHEPKTGPAQLVDVFDRGKSLTPAEAQAMCEELSGLPWQESYLQTITSRAILERMLRNLVNVARESRDAERMLRYTEAVLCLNPESAQDHLNLGILCYQTQRWQQARSAVEWLSTHDSAVGRDTIEELGHAIARESEK
ncbi:transglutaminase family protein [Schlesneria paludicola]|uniref:transglutaminase family protein n=1 Tax=Schlesneria paludicola TaxID=360056 RepID=UPI000299F3F5|nr:transglutaminase family protein [Schlesneria paludicola]